MARTEGNAGGIYRLLPLHSYSCHIQKYSAHCLYITSLNFPLLSVSSLITGALQNTRKSRGVNRLNSSSREDIPVHGAKEVVIVVVVGGHNLGGRAADGDGCLADVREVVSCDYLHVL